MMLSFSVSFRISIDKKLFRVCYYLLSGRVDEEILLASYFFVAQYITSIDQYLHLSQQEAAGFRFERNKENDNAKASNANNFHQS